MWPQIEINPHTSPANTAPPGAAKRGGSTGDKNPVTFMALYKEANPGLESCCKSC